MDGKERIVKQVSYPSFSTQTDLLGKHWEGMAGTVFKMTVTYVNKLFQRPWRTRSSHQVPIFCIGTKPKLQSWTGIRTWLSHWVSCSLLWITFWKKPFALVDATLWPVCLSYLHFVNLMNRRGVLCSLPLTNRVVYIIGLFTAFLLKQDYKQNENKLEESGETVFIHVTVLKALKYWLKHLIHHWNTSQN